MPWVILAVVIAVVVAAGAGWRLARPAGSTQSGDEAIADGGGGAAAPFELSSVEQTTFTVGLDTFPTFSPDGAMLAFSSNRQGRFELFAKSFAPGGVDRQITQDGQQNVQPDWSPDGRLLAYHSIARGGIWTVPATGGSARLIAEVGGAPRWSPDGKAIAYQTSEIASIDELALLPPSTLQIVTVADGVARPLTRPGSPIGGHSQPAWSPDGRHIVFLVTTNRTAEIWTVAIADGALSLLMPCGIGCKTPMISPDGQWLYYTVLDPVKSLRRVRLSADGRSVVKPVMGMSIQAGANLHGFAMTRDGARIAFGVSSVRSGLEIVQVGPEATGVSKRETVTHDTSRRNAWPAFSSDGRRVLYTSWRSGQGQQVWLMDADGGNPQQLTDGRLINMAPAWLPGDQEVAYQVRQADTFSLTALNLITRRTRELFSFGLATPTVQSQFAAARLMRDGRHLIYGRFDNGHGEIWATDLQTRAARQITSSTQTANFPVSSSDGQWVAYEVYDGASMQLAAVRIDGRENRVLTSGRGLTWPNDFSPDATRIVCAYRRDGVWNVGWIARDGGPLHPLTDFTSAAGFVRYPAWSPTGDRIVFEHAEMEGNLWVGTLAAPRPPTE